MTEEDLPWLDAQSTTEDVDHVHEQWRAMFFALSALSRLQAGVPRAIRGSLAVRLCHFLYVRLGVRGRPAISMSIAVRI